VGLIFDNIDLGLWGLVTPGIEGIHSQSASKTTEVFVPGYSLPHGSDLRDDLVAMKFECVVGGNDHADLVDKLHGIRKLISPRMGWKHLMVPDLPGLRTLARFDGFTVAIEAIPYVMRVVEFTLTGRRAPWWEDADPQTVAITTSTATITNTGDLPAWPVWTVTALAAAASGIWFEVGSERFTWSDALSAGDTLTITTELPDIELNGSRNLAGASLDAAYPALTEGANSITLSDSTLFSLAASYRRRYE
jgi:hypothetical protein